MTLLVDQGIAPGMQFHNKDDCILAIRFYHMNNSMDYKVQQSDTERYVIKCKDPKCGFKVWILRAEVIKSNSHQVTQFDRDWYTVSVRETIDHKE